MKYAIAAILAIAVLGGIDALRAGGVAEAYPQFTLSRDKTCTGCHVSPAGGGLLNENGENVAESIGMRDHSAKFFYGAIPTPDWLSLGGDARAATGFIQTPEKAFAAFPMQYDLYAQVKLPNGFSLHLTGGFRPAQFERENATRVWSREHYVMWRTEPGTPNGLFVRAGRFMPVFGLRFIEHPLYTRRFGGTPLFGETYAAAVEYVQEKYEVHATGFIKDPVIDPVLHESGGALYGEFRPTEHASIGAGGMLQVTDDDKKFRGAITGKYYVTSADILLQAEAQIVNQRVDGGGAPVQLIGSLVATRTLGKGFMLDLGLGHFDSNVRIKDLDRNAVDLNLHWFMDSHLELLLTGRFEVLALTNGGDSGAYALIQAHYRL